MDVEKQLEWASLLKINKGRTNEKEGSERLLAPSRYPNQGAGNILGGAFSLLIS